MSLRNVFEDWFGFYVTWRIIWMGMAGPMIVRSWRWSWRAFRHGWEDGRPVCRWWVRRSCVGTLRQLSLFNLFFDNARCVTKFGGWKMKGEAQEQGMRSKTGFSDQRGKFWWHKPDFEGLEKETSTSINSKSKTLIFRHSNSTLRLQWKTLLAAPGLHHEDSVVLNTFWNLIYDFQIEDRGFAFKLIISRSSQSISGYILSASFLRYKHGLDLL